MKIFKKKKNRKREKISFSPPLKEDKFIIKRIPTQIIIVLAKKNRKSREQLSD